MLIHRGALIIPSKILPDIEKRQKKSKNRGAIIVICDHLGLFWIKEIMLVQAEGEHNSLSSCQFCYNIRNLMNKIRPLVLLSQALASWMFKYYSTELKCFFFEKHRSLSPKTAGLPFRSKTLSRLIREVFNKWSLLLCIHLSQIL